MLFKVSKRENRGTWEVRWFQNGKKRKTFKTQDAALLWVRDQKKLVAAGASPFQMTAAVRLAAGTGFDLETLVRAGLEQMRGLGASKANVALTFAEASELVIARAKKRGARERTLEGYRAVYSVLNKALGPRAVATLTQTEVEDYLNQMTNAKGTMGFASVATKRGHLCHIRMCMRMAGIALPLPELVLPDDHSDVDFFTLDEIKLILSATPEEARGFVAVALFACVRPENLELLPEDCVSVENRRIRIPKGIAKDKHGHLLEDKVPAVLWAWLRRYPFKRVNWSPLQRRLKRAVGRWIHDGLRHTGATYYCAVNGVNATAQLLTHESERLVRSNYAGMIASNDVAKKFFKQSPDRIKFKIADGVKWPEDAVLAGMLQIETGKIIAERLGCSDSALTKHCRVRGILKPGRGHWASAAA